MSFQDSRRVRFPYHFAVMLNLAKGYIIANPSSQPVIVDGQVWGCSVWGGRRADAGNLASLEDLL